MLQGSNAPMGQFRAVKEEQWSMYRVTLLLWVGALAWTCAPNRVFADPPSAPSAPRANYREPERGYLVERAGDFTLYIEEQLRTEKPEVARQAIARLTQKRRKVLSLLPSHARRRLERVPLYLMYGPEARGGGKGNGLEYFQKRASDYDANLNPAWRDAIVIYCAYNYANISDLWATKALLQEYAHAWQLEQWPERQPDILQAWEHARDAGLYVDVPDLESGERHERAYALTNQLEYFAELSCIYFFRCNYLPADRRALKRYDPDGCAMIEKMWRR